MKFSKVLYPNMFILDETTGKYVVTITAETIGFGTQHLGIVKVQRKESNTDNWKPVLYYYEVDTSGNVYLYFDIIFTGKVSFITDETIT